MNIPNEAIDAAFNAWWTANAYPGMDRADQDAARGEIRLHLEAAAPYLYAAVLRDAAKQIREESASALEYWADEMEAWK